MYNHACFVFVSVVEFYKCSLFTFTRNVVYSVSSYTHAPTYWCMYAYPVGAESARSAYVSADPYYFTTLCRPSRTLSTIIPPFGLILVSFSETHTDCLYRHCYSPLFDHCRFCFCSIFIQSNVPSGLAEVIF